MNSPVKATLTRCGRSSHDRIDSSIGTSLKILLSTKFTDGCKHSFVSRLDKSISNITSIVDGKFPTSRVSKKGLELLTSLKSMNDLSSNRKLKTMQRAGVSSSMPYNSSAQPVTNLSPTQKGCLSCGHTLGNNYYNFLSGRHLSRSTVRNYSNTFINHNSRSSNGENENSGQPTPADDLDPAAVTTTFCDGDEEGHKYDISSEEFEGAISDLEGYLHPQTATQADTQHPPKDTSVCHDGGWILEWTGPHVTIWSRPIEGRDYLEYRVHGHYEDIPAIAFFYIQMNLTHRKRWDKCTDALELISSHDDADYDKTELIYWRVNFPRLMSKRDYVFARRHLVDIEKNIMVLYNKAVGHPGRPVNAKFVRVTDYDSKMMIKPHNSFTEDGFDYVMTYVDDTKTNMPSIALKKLVRKALPEFLETVHKESKAVVTKYRKLKESDTDIACSGDGRVVELDMMIEQAIARQYYGQLKQQQCTDHDTADVGVDQSDKDSEDGSRGTAKRSPFKARANGVSTEEAALIRKIHPPEYLPDWRKYIETVLNEGRWTPVPFKRVHSYAGASHSPKRWCRGWTSD